MSSDLTWAAEALDRYNRVWPAETVTVERFRLLLREWPACLDRRHMPGHLTASAWVTYPPTDEVLLTHHRKLDKWLQLGGHADGDPDLGRVARTEVLEESGIRELESVRPGGAPHLDTGSMPAIFDLDIHEVPAFGGVPAHLHYDVRCAFVAARRSEPVVSHESHDVAWVRLDRLEDYTVEPSMMRMREKWWGTRPRRPASASRTTD